MRSAGLVVALSLCLASNPAFAAPPKSKTSKTKKTSAKTPAKTATAAKPAPKKPEFVELAGQGDRSKLLNPAALNAKAPDVFHVRFDTSKGTFAIEVHRSWSPRGADRFYNLVSNGFYDDVRFFRVISGFMAQFGINGDPAVNQAWQNAQIEDDPVTQPNLRGTVSFAMRGPNTRTTQLFINYSDQNTRLDSMGFSPIGQVVEGMDVVDKLHAGYSEGAPRGNGPAQDRLQAEGNAYLERDFPLLDFVKTARVLLLKK